MIKMSEAMRKGAKMGPQLFNDGYRDMGRGGTCAYWAVIVGGSDVPVIPCECPVKNCDRPYSNGGGEDHPYYPSYRPQYLGEVLVHLNNDHRWTRECIAGWIEVTYEGGIPSKEIMELIGEPEKTRELVCIRPNPKPKGE